MENNFLSRIIETIKSEMGTEHRFGLMAQSMKGNGETIRLVVMASSVILMVTFLKDNGKMIKQMVMVYIFISTDQGMKGTGRMIYNMEKVLRVGMTEAVMWASTRKE